EEVRDDLAERRRHGRDLPRDHLVERQAPPEPVLELAEELRVAEAVVDHVQRVELGDRPVTVQDERGGLLVVIHHRRRQPAGSDQPPSITTTCPRIISASGEERNETTPAMSSGVTRRPAGFAAPDASISSRLGKCSSAPVSTTPADTAFTRIPRGASSTARYRTSASSAAFETPTSV